MAAFPLTTPVFNGPPKPFSGVASTVNTNRDGTGTMADMYVADANGAGADIKALLFTHAGAQAVASTLMLVRLYHKLVGGTYKLIGEFPLASATPSASTAGSKVRVANSELPSLKAGEAIAMAPSVGEAVAYYGIAAEYAS